MVSLRADLVLRSTVRDPRFLLRLSLSHRLTSSEGSAERTGSRGMVRHVPASLFPSTSFGNC
eukprot:scaffold221_cov351-Pavlova_lutheri.AAC.18